MKSEIVFFDTFHNSLLGTKRSLISFIPLLIIFAIIILVMNNNINPLCEVIGAILFSFVLCSAIAVQLPKNCKEAGIFGLLVGFVVGASITGTAFMYLTKPPLIFKGSILILPLITSALSLLTFNLSNRFKLYS